MRTLSCGRRAARKSVDIPCSVKPRRGRKRRQRIADLSRLGAWLETRRPLAIGELVELTFREVTLRAEVMWTRSGHGMGVEFVAHEPTALTGLLDGAPDAPDGDAVFTFADAY